jgi:quercetin 2,3-dioxygenase
MVEPMPMTILLRPNAERGLTRTSWLTSLHTFSFGHYYNPDFMSFRTLRVINEDTVMAQSGFGAHSHRDMEIVTIVLKGVLTHQDSLGHNGQITAGEIQRMTAGTGIVHSEMNTHEQEEVHFLQIWITPLEKNLPPSYQQSPFIPQLNELVVIAAPNLLDNGVHIHQNATIALGSFDEHHVTAYPCRENHGYWIQVIDGEMSINDMVLTSGDGIGLEGESSLLFRAYKKTVFLLFELG